MFAIGIYSIVNLQQYGFFTQNTYVSGAAIFVVAGSFKVVFGLLGILVLFWQKKPLMITVRERGKRVKRGERGKRGSVCARGVAR